LFCHPPAPGDDRDHCHATSISAVSVTSRRGAYTGPESDPNPVV